MDPITELLLQKAARVKNWEDEESASYDLETLRAEFHKRLCGDKAAPEDGWNGAAGKKDCSKSGKVRPSF
jgi:hypothetical protein